MHPSPRSGQPQHRRISTRVRSPSARSCRRNRSPRCPRPCARQRGIALCGLRCSCSLAARTVLTARGRARRAPRRREPAADVQQQNGSTSRARRSSIKMFSTIGSSHHRHDRLTAQPPSLFRRERDRVMLVRSKAALESPRSGFRFFLPESASLAPSVRQLRGHLRDGGHHRRLHRHRGHGAPAREARALVRDVRTRARDFVIALGFVIDHRGRRVRSLQDEDLHRRLRNARVRRHAPQDREDLRVWRDLGDGRSGLITLRSALLVLLVPDSRTAETFGAAVRYSVAGSRARSFAKLLSSRRE